MLTVTEMLRKKGVVDKFVEFFGDGLEGPAAGRPRDHRQHVAGIRHRTCAIFPIDEETIRYLELTGRPPEQIALVEAYATAQGLWRIDGAAAARLHRRAGARPGDASSPSLAGPKRPQDRVPLRSRQGRVSARAVRKMAEERSQQESGGRRGVGHAVVDGTRFEVKDGAVLIAAITSCTNTSNPDGAGRRRTAGAQCAPAAASTSQALGEDLAGARLARRHRLSAARPACSRTWRRSASTRWATAAPPASAIPDR